MLCESRCFGLMMLYPDELFDEMEKDLWKMHIKDCKDELKKNVGEKK